MICYTSLDLNQRELSIRSNEALPQTFLESPNSILDGFGSDKINLIQLMRGLHGKFLLFLLKCAFNLHNSLIIVEFYNEWPQHSSNIYVE